MENSIIRDIRFLNTRVSKGIDFHNYKVKTDHHEGETFFVGKHATPQPGDNVSYEVEMHEKFGLKLKKMIVTEESKQTDMMEALDVAEKIEETGRLVQHPCQVNYEMKLSALEWAVKHHAGKDHPGEDVIETAKKFIAYLM